jgi:SAM-dependent methyltransferase
MDMNLPESTRNADQITYWNNRAGEVWAAQQARIDALFAPLTATVLDAAPLSRGQSVLDVGCGCGTTVLELARRVGPEGHVLGVDISRPMLEVAAERVAAGHLGHAALTLADAATHRFHAGAYDLVFSRFGVMFFDDPAAAFTNIRGALSAAGRLFFVCWKPITENPWFAVPVAAVTPFVAPQPPADPHAPGPFAFADPERVRGILTQAGFHDVEIVPQATTMRWDDVGAAADFLQKVGPASRLLAEADPAAKEAAGKALRSDLARFETADGVRLGGAVWLVSARQ